MSEHFPIVSSRSIRTLLSSENVVILLLQPEDDESVIMGGCVLTGPDYNETTR